MVHTTSARCWPPNPLDFVLLVADHADHIVAGIWVHTKVIPCFAVDVSTTRSIEIAFEGAKRRSIELKRAGLPLFCLQLTGLRVRGARGPSFFQSCFARSGGAGDGVA